MTPATTIRAFILASPTTSVKHYSFRICSYGWMCVMSIPRGCSRHVLASAAQVPTHHHFLVACGPSLRALCGAHLRPPGWLDRQWSSINVRAGLTFWLRRQMRQRPQILALRTHTG